jgi:predicted solute-binding protein
LSPALAVVEVVEVPVDFCAVFDELVLLLLVFAVFAQETNTTAKAAAKKARVILFI